MIVRVVRHVALQRFHFGATAALRVARQLTRVVRRYPVAQSLHAHVVPRFGREIVQTRRFGVSVHELVDNLIRTNPKANDNYY